MKKIPLLSLFCIFFSHAKTWDYGEFFPKEHAKYLAAKKEKQNEDFLFDHSNLFDAVDFAHISTVTSEIKDDSKKVLATILAHVGFCQSVLAIVDEDALEHFVEESQLSEKKIISELNDCIAKEEYQSIKALLIQIRRYFFYENYSQQEIRSNMIYQVYRDKGQTPRYIIQQLKNFYKSIYELLTLIFDGLEFE